MVMHLRTTTLLNNKKISESKNSVNYKLSNGDNLTILNFLKDHVKLWQVESFFGNLVTYNIHFTEYVLEVNRGKSCGDDL
jgi:hypothetical protein